MMKENTDTQEHTHTLPLLLIALCEQSKPEEKEFAPNKDEGFMVAR